MRLGSKLLVGTIIFLAVVFIAGGILFWKRPLEIYAWFGRRALAKAGLQRVVVDTPAGRQVAWQGGSGPTLVFLHGAGDQAATWCKVLPPLVANYRLIVPDLPGHGGSAPEAGPLSIGTVLAGTAALLDNVAPGKPVILVGNSLGAWIGMLLALEKPERVTRLVIINGGGSKGERPDLTLTPANRAEARKLMSALRDPGSPFIPDFVLDDVIRHSQSGPIGRLANAAVEMEKYLLDNRLQALEVPVDLVWGESDRLFSVDYARRMLAQLPAARLTIIPRCGHVPQQECPDKFREELIKILHQEPPSSVP